MKFYSRFEFQRKNGIFNANYQASNTALMPMSTTGNLAQFSHWSNFSQKSPFREVIKELASSQHKPLINSHTNTLYEQKFELKTQIHSKTMTWTF
jgi:hypothetical protein